MKFVVKVPEEAEYIISISETLFERDLSDREKLHQAHAEASKLYSTKSISVRQATPSDLLRYAKRVYYRPTE